jgi:hypothetical protein
MLEKSVALFIAVVTACVLWSPSVLAQETQTLVGPTPTAEGDSVTQIFKVAFADVNDIAEVISLFQGTARPNRDLGVIAWTGPGSLLPAVEAAIRSLDVPPVPEPNVEITVWFLMAAKSGTGTKSIPASLDGVAVQLEDVFGYDSVRLIETTAIRVRHGSRGDLSGILPKESDGDHEARYNFSFRRAWVSEDGSGRSIRLDGLSTGVHAPHTVIEDGKPVTRPMHTGISTDIDLRENQKAVIGKTSIEGGDATVFIVVTGKIVE